MEISQYFSLWWVWVAILWYKSPPDGPDKNPTSVQIEVATEMGVMDERGFTRFNFAVSFEGYPIMQQPFRYS